MTPTAPEAVSVPARARNPITLAGAGLTTASAIAFITFYVIDALGLFENPYAGLIGYVLFPALFVLGLLLIPLGIWRESRRRTRGKQPWHWPVVNLGSATTRRVVSGVLVLTLVNLGLVAIAGFGAAHYMESTEFCGQVCHEPMKPQFTAHQVGAHASVSCVSCHVSPGAAGAIRAKVAGTRQLWQVAAHNFPRPIRAEGRVPAAAETCVTCHRAGFAARDTTKVIREYSEDEANTETVTTVDLLTRKIHDVHARPGVVMEYARGDQPDTIGYVRASRDGGEVTEFFGPGVTAAPSGTLRQMDCLDCHSRPAHAFGVTPERAVNTAIAAGELNRAMPFVRREVAAAMKTDYPDEASAMEGIGNRLNAFYSSTGRNAGEVASTIEAARRLYRTNVFPEMKVTWGTHLFQNSHIDSPGCFRCHTDEHKARGGRVIKQDCEACHIIR